MELTGWLLSLARPHPLVVVAPGATRARLAVERALRERGWPAAATAAEADLVVSCGPLGPAMTAVAEELWRQLPSPRARVHVDADHQAAAALTAGHTWLVDAAAQRVDGAARLPASRAEETDRQAGSHGNHGHAHGDHRHGSGHDHGSGPGDAGTGNDGTAHHHGSHDTAHGAGSQDAAGQEDRRSGQDGHGDGHEHGHHGAMGMVAGFALAERAPDRDGLMLDRLHVPLGPVLPDWPAGLVLHVELQGDVVQQAQADLLDRAAIATPPGGVAFWDEPWLRAATGERVRRGAAARRRAAAHLDSLGRLLGVAGWSDASLAARRLRDDLLAGLDASAVTSRFARLARRLRRSRTLRWLTDGLGALDPALAATRGIGGPARRGEGDVTARWLRWLEETAAALDDAGDDRPLAAEELEGPRGPLADGNSPSQALLGVLPELVVGAELAAVRLIVASLDPDPDQLVDTPAAEPTHG